MNEAHPTLATFLVQRDQDASGISGTGVVAEGVQFSDGWVVTHWLDQAPMWEPKTDVWHHKGTGPVTKIHGHGGATRIVWTRDKERQGQEFLADVAEAFDIPGWVVGTEAERVSLHRQMARALLDVWHARGTVFAHPEDHCGKFADAVMPIVGPILEQRTSAQAAVGRARALADRWQTAHGSSMFLVRAAAAELRDVLDDSGDAPGEVVHSGVKGQASALSGVDYVAAAECSAQHHGFPGDHRECIRAAQHRGDHIDEHGFHWSDTVAVYPVVDGEPQCGRAYASSCSNPDHACKICGDCVRQHPGEGGCFAGDQLSQNQSPLAGVEVRDPCPRCEDGPLIPRNLMDNHIREHHPELRVGGPGTPLPDAEPDDFFGDKCPHCDQHPPRNRLDEHVATVHADLPPCTATLDNEHYDRTLSCVFRVGHRDGEYGDYHASARGELGRTVWADWAKGATPHREPHGMEA